MQGFASQFYKSTCWKKLPKKKKAIKCHVSNISMQMGTPHTIYSQGIFTDLIRGTVLLWINPLKLSFKNPIT